MADSFKISGKKIPIPTDLGTWTYSVRPGGWIIAERKTETGSERKRFALSESKGRVSSSLGGFLFHGEVIAAVRGSSGGGGSDSDLVAQFPGKVRKILVAAGASVKAGDPLILVEAMKMEFSVKAPFDGIVETIRVAEGQQLSPGDRFVDLIPSKEKL